VIRWQQHEKKVTKGVVNKTKKADTLYVELVFYIFLSKWFLVNEPLDPMLGGPWI
jgi:hypothetical protein